MCDRQARGKSAGLLVDAEIGFGLIRSIPCDPIERSLGVECDSRKGQFGGLHPHLPRSVKLSEIRAGKAIS